VSEEKVASILDHLEKTSHPEIKDNRAVIQAIIADKSKSREFQAFLASDPNFALRMMADAVESETLRAITRVKKIEETRLKNEEEARKKAALLASGGSDNHLGAGGDAGKPGGRFADIAI
jgi:glycerate-2-kinase